MKKLLLIVIPVFIFSCKVQKVSNTSSNSVAQYTSIERKEYIKIYKDLAIKEMSRSGIPASITLAQGMLESDNGNSTLARKGNNHFGIKCHGSWKGAKMYHDDDRRGECFRKYRSVYESYKDHSEFLVNGNRYAFLFDLKPTDYKSWAKGLQKAGYATSRTYAHLLIKIIEDNQLYMFDKGGSLSYNNAVNVKNDSNELILADVDNFTIHHNKHTIYTKNRIDYIFVKQGDTFRSLTDELELLPWELYKYNELDEGAKLVVGQILYIQPKRNKAEHSSDYHVVKEREDMYLISQMYGIKIKKLYEKNLMEIGTKPELGQKLWLRKIKPYSELVKETPLVEEFDE